MRDFKQEVAKQEVAQGIIIEKNLVAEELAQRTRGSEQRQIREEVAQWRSSGKLRLRKKNLAREDVAWRRP